MAHRRISAASILAGAALLTSAVMPSLAAAGGYWHPANTQAGVTVHPDHFQSTKTREQVQSEAIDALRNGDMTHVSESGEPKVVSTGPTLTRQQVVNALLNETPQERAARVRALR